jgi:UDP-N-acetyl-D-mannosaminuronic acid dehydrogenase
MTFKANVDDFRSSLSFKIRDLLESNGARVLCSDAVLHMENFVSLEEVIGESDLIVIATPHQEYKSLDTAKPVIDIWRKTGISSIF